MNPPSSTGLPVVIAAGSGGSSPVGPALFLVAVILATVVFIVWTRRRAPTAESAANAGSSAMEPAYGAYRNPGAQTNAMAILSLVFAFVFCPLAIIFGHIARKQIRERGEAGSGLATSGLVLGYVFTAIHLVFWIGIFVFLTRDNGQL